MKNSKTKCAARGDLLDEIAVQLGCPFLSDLNRTCWKAFVRLALPPAERYSLRQWNDAVRYIFQVNEDYKTPEDAHRAMAELSEQECRAAADFLTALKL